MLISELISQLEEALEDQGDVEVRIATQPSWPLAFEVHGVHVPEQEQMDGPCPEHDTEDCDECNPTDPAVWIGTGETCEHPYAPKDAWGY